MGQRRVHVLASHLAALLPKGATVLDVGCGDGELAYAVGALRPDISIRGVDVLVRATTRVPVEPFDGAHLPIGDRSVDVIMMIDVLHHTDDPTQLLREAARCARTAVVIKDHLADAWLARPTLRFMDWVGNAPHGVRLPYNYWPQSRWRSSFEALGLHIEQWLDRLGLYPAPASALFDRRLHFLARLRPTGAGPSS